MTLLRTLAPLVLFASALTAEDGPITTWRGPAYDGVMPARDLVTSFVWFDEDAPPIGEVEAGMFDPKVTAKAPMTHQPGARVNALWRTELPSWGQSAPIAVGDKVFVTCDAVPGTEGKHVLVCVDIPSGKLDWIRPIDHLLAWKDQAAAAKVQAIRLAEVNGWAEAMRVWNSVWWDNEKFRRYAGADAGQAWGEFQACKEYMKPGPHPDRQAAFDAAVAKGYKAIDRGYWREVGRFGHAERLKQFKEAKETRARIYTHNKEAPWYGSTCGSAVGDGKAVYAVAAPDALVCYELDGKLRWAADLEVGPRTGGMAGGSHRDMSAPVLVDGRILWHTTTNFTTFAYDCATGRQAWKVQLPAEWYTDGKHPNYPQFKQGVPKHYHAHMGPGGTAVPMRLADKNGGTPVSVIVLPTGHVHRVSDGKVLGWFSTLQPDIVDDGYGSRPQYELYATAVAKGDVYFSIKATATRLWLEGDSLKSESLWVTPATKKGEKGRGLYNPYHSLILTETGVLAGDLMVDQATGKQTLQSICRGRRPNGNLSGCISADGLYIWRGHGDQGGKSMRYMIIGLGDVADARATPSARFGFGLIAEGRYSDAVHQRNIDRFGTPRISLGWAHPTAFGNRIFVRTHAYLYCFGKGPLKPTN